MTTGNTSLPQESINPQVARLLLSHAEERLAFWSETIRRIEEDMEIARAQYARVNADLMKYREVITEKERPNA